VRRPAGSGGELRAHVSRQMNRDLESHSHFSPSLARTAAGLAGLESRVARSECVIVLGALSEPSSSRLPGDIFVQRGREAVGHGHRSNEDPRCQARPGP
jgi:hypothetical protein